MDAVFCNELILEQIFHYLSTPDLLLRVNRVASKWNQLVTELVRRKRQVSLHNHNILDYVDMLKCGGAPHKHIKLKLNKLENKLKGAEEIASALDKFGENIRKLDIIYANYSDDWDNGLTEHTRMEANFLHQLLLHSPNVECLSLIINSSEDSINVYELLNIQELPPFPALKFLKIGAWIYNGNFNMMLIPFLNRAPNLEIIHLKTDLSVEDFKEIEPKFPDFIGKIATISIFSFDKERVQYLLSKNFCSLKYFHLTGICDNGDFLKVLEKYAAQIVHLSFGITQDSTRNFNYFITVDEELPDYPLHFPVMKNLKTLRLFRNNEEYLGTKRIPFCFCNCLEEDERVFPKLENFELDLQMEDDDDYCWSEPVSAEFLDAILLTALQDLPNHPIFPNVKTIAINAIGLENYGKWMKPELCSRVKKYFPNVDCRSWDEPYNFKAIKIYTDETGIE